jgi:hypothetical protein
MHPDPKNLKPRLKGRSKQDSLAAKMHKKRKKFLSFLRLLRLFAAKKSFPF